MQDGNGGGVEWECSSITSPPNFIVIDWIGNWEGDPGSGWRWQVFQMEQRSYIGENVELHQDQIGIFLQVLIVMIQNGLFLIKMIGLI